MLASVERGDHGIRVQAGRRAHDHEPHLRIAQQAVDAFMRGDAQLALREGPPFSRHVAHGMQVQARGRDDRSRVRLGDGAVSHQADADGGGGLHAGRQQSGAVHELLEVGVLVRAGAVTQADVDEPSLSVPALVSDDLVAELPARAHQDRGARGRALGQQELVLEPDLRSEPLRQGMARDDPHDELGQPARAAGPPSGHLRDGVQL